MYATYEMLGHDLSRGILVSAYGFPPVGQGNWRHTIIVDGNEWAQQQLQQLTSLLRPYVPTPLRPYTLHLAFYTLYSSSARLFRQLALWAHPQHCVLSTSHRSLASHRSLEVSAVDEVHGGPLLPTDGPVPSAICLVNPFGYRCDVAYYRKYCDDHGCLLWFDNAACPW